MMLKRNEYKKTSMTKAKGRLRYYKHINENGAIALLDGFGTDAETVLVLFRLKKKIGKEFEEITHEEFVKLEAVLEKPSKLQTHLLFNKEYLGILDD